MRILLYLFNSIKNDEEFEIIKIDKFKKNKQYYYSRT